MAYEIQNARVRKALPVRLREPYWRQHGPRGRSLGFRKITADRGSWIARMRPADGGAKYEYEVLEALDYAGAADEAEKWFKLRTGGVKAGEVVTVADACRAYVKERRKSKSEACAHDAEKRFERTVYKDKLGRMELVKVGATRVREWRDGLKLKPAAANRTLTVLRAALNLAVNDKHASGELTVDLRRVEPLPGGDNRRELYLKLKQRAALLKAAKGRVRDLIEAAALTGARAGELVRATVSQFDAHAKEMTFITGKQKGGRGKRTVKVSPAAQKLFKRLAAGKEPGDSLFTRDDGQPWAHSDWDEGVRHAAKAAGLPAESHTGVCLYTLRHSFITDKLTKGNSTLAVALYVGTSVVMIGKHYGQKSDDAQKRLVTGRMI